NIDNRFAAMLTLSLYVGAFYAEIFRGGIVSIDKGQREAAAAIGMSPFQSMRCIILPQALKRVLPSFINQSVIQFKNTSLVSVISVADLAYMAAVVNGQTYRPLESYTVMAVLYIVVLLPLMQAADWFEKRLRVSD
ncbi:amino acid ABC transporter permease, partial [Martelella sp. UBA3392]